MNRIDKLIGVFAPQYAAKRARARADIERTEYARTVLSHHVRKYEAATAGRRGKSWRASSSDPNSEVMSSLQTVRDRHRQLIRDNPWAKRCKEAIVSNAISYGISTTWSDPRIQAEWDAWFGALVCDADGMHNGYGLQALLMGAIVESGDVLIRRRWRRPQDGLALPMQLQVMEADYLDTTRDGQLASGARIIGGVQFSPFGKREGYWVFRNHPGDALAPSLESTFVDAKEMQLVYRVDRPGQVRGMPWGHAVMLTVKDLDGYEDAYLLRNELANCHVGVLHDSNPLNSSAVSVEDSEPMPEKFEPGRLLVAPPGMGISFNDPPRPDGYGPFTTEVKYRIAAGYGVSYEAMTGNLKDVNFSSGRMGWLEFQRNIEAWRWNMFIPQALETVCTWFREALALSGRVPQAVIDRATYEHRAPKREMIDPNKEVDGMIKKLESGLSSWTGELSEMGESPQSVLDQIAADRAAFAAAGIPYPFDKIAPAPVQQEASDDDDETEA